jgi:hypothetical protein
MLAASAACSSLPSPKVTDYEWPKNAYLGKDQPGRQYEKIGLVRTKVTYPTLLVDREESELCKNYFNKAAIDLLKRAKDKGGDAVIGVESVVYTMDSKTETYPRAECFDDGDEGQVLAQGYAIRWKKDEKSKD